jgi:hypothetical protein
MAPLPPPNAELPIDLLLGRLANHVANLADTLAFVENAASKHFGDSLARDAEAFQDVQNLDYVHQSLTDIAALLTSLGTGDRTRQSLIHSLKLEATRGLLQSSPAQSEAIAPQTIDIF